jgi:hypothetical protein
MRRNTNLELKNGRAGMALAGARRADDGLHASAIPLIACLMLCALALSATDAVAANCYGRMRLCDNCDTNVTFFTQKNTACTVPYPVVGGMVHTQKVVRKPRGVYGTANPAAGAYQPPQGFVGEDYFEVEINYERSGQRYKTTMKATVKISD